MNFTSKFMRKSRPRTKFNHCFKLISAKEKPIFEFCVRAETSTLINW